MHSMPELIERKRDGGALTADELRWIVDGYVDGDLPDYQVSALLMAILFRGLSADELAVWTEAMLRSGDMLDFSHVPEPKVDKHSTGGVGDKVSIPLAPIAAACGLAVPMMSGRGLGHTGGTLDKLEAIPGFRTQLDPREFGALLEQHGLVLAGQSETLVPADRRLYALRDATGTVPSVPLISSSIMSKKLAEGLDGLVLDVKVGSGAFMKTLEDARLLAETMVGLGGSHGTDVVALLTRMDQPLGNAVGNANEIVESIEVLYGNGPADLREIVERLATEMLLLGGLVETPEAASQQINHAIASGEAADRFAAVIEAQGGDPGVVGDPGVLPRARHTAVVEAPAAGNVARCDALDIGRAVVRLGGGRRQISDAVDASVGVMVHAKLGDEVAVGGPLATVSYNAAERLESAMPLLETAWSIEPEATEVPDLIIDTIRA